MKFEKYISRLPSVIITGLKNEIQDPIYHKEGSVYNHLKMMWDYAVKNKLDGDILTAIIFHDLGKLDTRSERIDKEGRQRVSHIGHEYKSLDYFKKYHGLYKDLYNDYDAVENIIKSHMKAHLYISGDLKKAAKRKAFEENPYFEDIITFSSVDDNGRL